MHFAQVPTVAATELPPAATLLDVREPLEWEAGHAEGAVHVPMSELPGRLAGPDSPIRPDEPVVVVCRVGSRSAHVTAWLVQQGYDAVNLDGGMLAWQQAGRPLVGGTDRPPHVL